MAFTAFVSTYAPHRCGIATFTSDLASAVGPHQVVALHPVSGPAAYPSVVRHRIRRDSRGDYLAAAAALNASDVEVVSIQHEYGIWGGDDGAYVLDFVRALRRARRDDAAHGAADADAVPAADPHASWSGMSATTVVMSRAAASLLTRAYGVEPGRVRIVPARRAATCRWSTPTPSSRTSTWRAAW